MWSHSHRSQTRECSSTFYSVLYLPPLNTRLFFRSSFASTMWKRWFGQSWQTLSNYRQSLLESLPVKAEEATRRPAENPSTSPTLSHSQALAVVSAVAPVPWWIGGRLECRESQTTMGIPRCQAQHQVATILTISYPPVAGSSRVPRPGVSPRQKTPLLGSRSSTRISARRPQSTLRNPAPRSCLKALLLQRKPLERKDLSHLRQRKARLRYLRQLLR